MVIKVFLIFVLTLSAFSETEEIQEEETETEEFFPPNESKLIELIISKDISGILDAFREANEKLSCNNQVYFFQCLIGKVEAYNQRVRNA